MEQSRYTQSRSETSKCRLQRVAQEAQMCLRNNKEDHVAGAQGVNAWSGEGQRMGRSQEELLRLSGGILFTSAAKVPST